MSVSDWLAVIWKMSHLAASQLLIFVWFLALWNLMPSYYQREKCLKLEPALNRCLQSQISTICRHYSEKFKCWRQLPSPNCGIHLNYWIFTSDSHYPVRRSFPSEAFPSICCYPWDSGIFCAEQQHYPLVSESPMHHCSHLCDGGVALHTSLYVDRKLNYGTLNGTICRAWAKLWDIFSLCWPCHGPCCISLGNSCWVSSFSLSHITPGTWKASFLPGLRLLGWLFSQWECAHFSI